MYVSLLKCKEIGLAKFSPRSSTLKKDFKKSDYNFVLPIHLEYNYLYCFSLISNLIILHGNPSLTFTFCKSIEMNCIKHHSLLKNYFATKIWVHFNMEDANQNYLGITLTTKLANLQN